jgi:hypothetical protein
MPDNKLGIRMLPEKDAIAESKRNKKIVTFKPEKPVKRTKMRNSTIETVAAGKEKSVRNVNILRRFLNFSINSFKGFKGTSSSIFEVKVSASL